MTEFNVLQFGMGYSVIVDFQRWCRCLMTTKTVWSIACTLWAAARESFGEIVNELYIWMLFNFMLHVISSNIFKYMTFLWHTNYFENELLSYPKHHIFKNRENTTHIYWITNMLHYLKNLSSLARRQNMKLDRAASSLLYVCLPCTAGELPIRISAKVVGLCWFHFSYTQAHQVRYASPIYLSCYSCPTDAGKKE